MKGETYRYYGKRKPDGTTVVRRIRQGGEYLLPLRLDIENHSPTGFEWGYGGSGPAQLAVAIMADALHDAPRAQGLHQRFKWQIVSRFDKEYWSITRVEVMAVVDNIERRNTGRRVKP